MPTVTTVNNKLTIQMPKYSAPVPVKCICSGARAGGACEDESPPGELSINAIPFVFYRWAKATTVQTGTHQHAKYVNIRWQSVDPGDWQQHWNRTIIHARRGI